MVGISAFAEDNKSYVSVWFPRVDHTNPEKFIRSLIFSRFLSKKATDLKPNISCIS